MLACMAPTDVAALCDLFFDTDCTPTLDKWPCMMSLVLGEILNGRSPPACRLLTMSCSNETLLLQLLLTAYSLVNVAHDSLGAKP
jgi:hypothetical protein